MTLLDTVPIYITTPWWFIIIMIITGSTMLITFINGTSDKAGIIAGICLLILVIEIILGACGVFKVYSHDEYIIELDESASATEFFKNYEITKTFEYSNAWQVKKKDGVK
jgi:preprotein translocase subunit SecY